MSELTKPENEFAAIIESIRNAQVERERQATKCPSCETGLAYPGDRACWECLETERERQRQAYLRSQRVRDMRDKSNLPVEDLEAIVDGRLKATKALRHVQRWYASKGTLLVLCGGVGTGKSVAAVWALAQQGGEVVAAQELPQRIDPWGDERERVRVLRPKTGELVVLDDLGTESDSVRWQQAFGYFLDCRYAHGRTIITTNVPVDALRSRYGDRVADRINHVGTVVEVGSKSLRKEGRA